MRAELIAVITKELRQTARDKRMLALLVMAPVLQLTLLGYAVNLDVDHIPAAAWDLDKSATSRAFLEGLGADPTFDLRYQTERPERALTQGLAKVVVVIPPGFERDLLRAQPVALQALVDGTNPIQAQAALDHAQRFTWSFMRSLLPVERTQARLQLVPRILYNPSMRSPVYMVPGVAAVVLLLVTTVVTAMGIARERELGTIEQLLVTPLQPMILLLGKVLPFAGIGMVTAGLVLGVGLNLFDVPMRGPLGVIVLGTLLYLMSTLGVGVLISTVARTQQQAILLGFFFLMPAILLSGFMSPVDNMPEWIQPLSVIDPVRYYVELLRGCLLKGAGYKALWPQLLALALFGGPILTLASLRFSKRVK